MAKPAKRSFAKAIRSRKGGDRYPSGKLKPPAPNERVVELRRALLGAKPGEVVDLSRAENPLDVALARGWLPEHLHRAARHYAALLRADFSDLPTIKAGPLSRMMAPAALRAPDEGLGATGVVTEDDAALQDQARLLEQGKITPHQYALAERRHRGSKVDWARVPAADIARLWDAIAEATPPPRAETEGASAATPAVTSPKLGRIRLRLTPNMARELFNVTILGVWPAWMLSLARDLPLNRFETAERTRLLDGLSFVHDIVSPANRSRPLPVRSFSSTTPPPAVSGEPSQSPKR